MSKKRVKRSGIYQITNKRNGKKYIGQAKDLADRKEEHFDALVKGKHHNKYLQADFNYNLRKYGTHHLKFKVLETCSIYFLDWREAYFIDKLTRKGHDYNILRPKVIWYYDLKEKIINAIIFLLAVALIGLAM